LNSNDLSILENIITKYDDLAFKKNDILDAGIDKNIAKILYRSDIYTVSQLKKAYNKGKLEQIQGLGRKKLKEIEDFLLI
jgi:hypothetical protein